MLKLELVKVETETTKVYNPSDSFKFKLTMNNLEALDDDVEFEIFYFGDAYSENHDQKICHNIIGPLDKGKLFFELETSPIDLTKIPIKTLFGLTTILIVGKFHGEQFVRIGYVVDVKHQGIDSDKLIDEQPIEEEDFDDEENEDGENDDEENDDEENDDEDDEIEIMDDDELDDDGKDLDDDRNECCKAEGESCSATEEDDQDGLENAIADSLLPKSRDPIPLETPIVAGKDEFEYKGFKMYQSKIEMSLIEKPIVQVFEIDWNSPNDDENVVESSENESNVEEGDKIKAAKKPKVE